MKMLTGRLENGTVRLTEAPSWPDGTPVVVLVDVRPMTWKEAGSLVGPDEVGTWSGQMDSWEASGTIDPMPDARCRVTKEDLNSLPPPTPEEADDFARAMREVEEFNRACFQRQLEIEDQRARRDLANGSLPMTKDPASQTEP